ncbi:MAG: Ig domain-containing protein, partial [Opitutales bacterium]
MIDAPASSVDGLVNTGTGPDVVLGALADGTARLGGWLDETRISSVARSHAWARLSYETQRTDESFFLHDLEYLQAPVLPSDLNLTGAVGTAMEFQIKSTPPATYYEINGSIPSGLTFNPSLGVLYGTPDVNGTFEVNATAYNGQGSSTSTLSIQSKSTLESPVILPGEVISLMGREATIRGEIKSSGGAACSVTLYFGKTDENESAELWEQSLSLGSYFQGYFPVTLSNLDSGETYYYRFKASHSSESWSDSGSFTTRPYDQGILRIHTGLDDSGFASGWYWDQGNGEGEQKILEPTLTQTLYFAPDGTSWTLTKATFSFEEDLHLGKHLEKIILEGVNALSIESSGNITVGHSLIGTPAPSSPHLPGGLLTDGYDSYYPSSASKGLRMGLGNLGGYGGGQGPGKGLSSGSFSVGGASGGGGSYGGEGGPGGSGAGGITYGEANLDVLMGGSGGGLGNAGEAGAGGGAIELIASGKILVDQGAQISVRGGSVFVNPEIGANYSGGAGSGGSIRLVGATVQNLGILDVRGGSASGGDVREPGARFMRKSGGAGGGGRISLIADGEIQSGTTLVSGGAENGDGSAGLPGTLYRGPRTSPPQTDLILNEGTLVFDTGGSWKHTSGKTGKGTVKNSSIMV